MGTSQKSMRLLRRCFSEEEWTWLADEPEFKNALQEMRELDHTEDLIKLGLHLIYLARRGTLPSGRLPPSLLYASR
jgi:hypothetical protein